MTASHSSCPTQRTFRALLEWPALLMRMSTRPSSLTVHSTNERPCSDRETSASRATALPPAFAISATTAASMSAVERPIPVPPPVTIAIFPVSFTIRILSPRPDGLFEMIDARRAAVRHDLAHLVDDGGGGRVDEAAEKRHLDDGPVALRDADEARHVGGVEVFERDQVHARDFRRVRRERAGVIGPEDDGRDHESRARRVVVEEPEQLVAAELEPELFVELAERRDFRGLPRVHPPTRQRPLPCMGAQGRRALGQQEAATPLGVGKQDQGHGGGLAPLERRGPPVEGG